MKHILATTYSRHLLWWFSRHGACCWQVPACCRFHSLVHVVPGAGLQTLTQDEEVKGTWVASSGQFPGFCQHSLLRLGNQVVLWCLLAILAVTLGADFPVDICLLAFCRAVGTHKERRFGKLFLKPLKGPKTKPLKMRTQESILVKYRHVLCTAQT